MFRVELCRISTQNSTFNSLIFLHGSKPFYSTLEKSWNFSSVLDPPREILDLFECYRSFWGQAQKWALGWVMTQLDLIRIHVHDSLPHLIPRRPCWVFFVEMPMKYWCRSQGRAFLKISIIWRFDGTWKSNNFKIKGFSYKLKIYLNLFGAFMVLAHKKCQNFHFTLETTCLNPKFYQSQLLTKTW